MRRLLELALLVFAAAVALTPLPRSAVERLYSRGLYPLIQPRLTGFSNTIAIALFDVTLLVIVAAVFLLWVLRLRRATQGRVLRTAGILLLDTTAIAALLYCWFLAAWGLNYQREPLRAQLDFREDRVTAEGLQELAFRDVDAMNTLYDAASRGPWPAPDELPSELHAAFARAQGDVGMAWRAVPGQPKRSLLDYYFKRV